MSSQKTDTIIMGRNLFVKLTNRNREVKKYRSNQLVTIGEAFRKIIIKENWNQQIKVADVINNWEKIVGLTIANEIKPVEVKDGKLIVKIESVIWKKELKISKKMYLNKINDYCGDKSIKDIIY